MYKTLIMSGIAAIAFAAQPAQAALPSCDVSDISPTSPGFTTFGSFDCSGFVSGQAFAGSAQSQAILQGLLDDLFGVGVKDATTITFLKKSGLSSAMSYDLTTAPFNTPLNGITLIGMHFGAGTGSPGDGSGLQGNAATSSVLYLFDAGSNLEELFWKYNASSDLVLFSTGTPPPPAVPEPASWALMIAGIAAVGSVLRRKKVAVAFS